jgi:acetoin utilization deacetylase AcuC-like enzyme
MPGAGDSAYELMFRELIWPKAKVFKPDLLLVSAGFDAHWIDPLASAALSLIGYATMIRQLLLIADNFCRGRILFVLEGGYHLEALSCGVLNLIFGLTGKDEIIDPLGPAPRSEVQVSGLLEHLLRLHLLK